MDKKAHRVIAVFDCMVFLQAAARSNGPAGECLNYVRSGVVGLFSTEAILNEVKNVLARPKFRKQFKTLTDEMIASFLFEIENLASSSDQPPHSIKFPRDPKDEKFINLAIEVEADYIVSRDRDLLDLMTDHTDEAKGFRQRFRKLKIVDPVEFLRIIREMDLALEP